MAEHTIKIVIVNPQGFCFVQSFRYSVSGGSDTIVEFDDVLITYTGSWSSHASGWKESDQVGAFAEFTFNGDRIKLYSNIETYGGFLDVYIDGVLTESSLSLVGSQDRDISVYDDDDLVNNRLIDQSLAVSNLVGGKLA